MEKSNKNIFAVVMGFAAFILLVIIIAAVASMNKIDVSQAPTATSSVANRMLTQADGKNESYYAGENTDRILVNMGRDTYDITEYVVDWQYGLPIINLTKAAEKLQLDVRETYDEPVIITQIEAYAPSDNINIEERTPLYIVGTDGTYMKMMATSGIATNVIEPTATPSQINSSYRVNKTSDGYLISIDMLPYIDKDGKVYAPTNYLVNHQNDNTVVFTLQQHDIEVSE